RWEHVMSEAVEERLVELLHNPQISPYGMPIPGLAGLGAASDEAAHQALLEPVVSLLGQNQILSESAPEELGGRFVLLGVPEVVQTHPELLAQLGRAGLLAGGAFSARREDSGEVVVRALEAPQDEAVDEIRIPAASAASIVVRQG
ncbi:metal-dependent transcriptional regulator, partial [Rhizobium leguminosarum]|nr:metal-dependent transcriptional regulator [Rhizobium ruizarguesonis]